jgi:hypothetical protein
MFGAGTNAIAFSQLLKVVKAQGRNGSASRPGCGVPHKKIITMENLPVKVP